MYYRTQEPPIFSYQWDIFSSSPAVPGPTEDLEVIAATKEENSCTFPS